jgi:hypothetical protein
MGQKSKRDRAYDLGRDETDFCKDEGRVPEIPRIARHCLRCNGAFIAKGHFIRLCGRCTRLVSNYDTPNMGNW